MVRFGGARHDRLEPESRLSRIPEPDYEIWNSFNRGEIIDKYNFGDHAQAVAMKMHGDYWTAYVIDTPVANETEAAERTGYKLSEKIARAIFDNEFLKGFKYWL